MATLVIPQNREMDTRDVTAMLTRLHVGRLAFSHDGVIDIRPVHYVYAHGSIYGRTSQESPFVSGPDPRPVAFEVDEVESLHRWKSLIIRGKLHVLQPDGVTRDEWSRARDVLRSLVRGAFSDTDPTPDRTVLFRIGIDEITGRLMR